MGGLEIIWDIYKARQRKIRLGTKSYVLYVKISGCMAEIWHMF